MGQGDLGVIRQTRTYAGNIALYPYVRVACVRLFYFLLSVRNAKTKTDHNGNDTDFNIEFLYKYIFDEMMAQVYTEKKL